MERPHRLPEAYSKFTVSFSSWILLLLNRIRAIRRAIWFITNCLFILILLRVQIIPNWTILIRPWSSWGYLTITLISMWPARMYSSCFIASILFILFLLSITIQFDWIRRLHIYWIFYQRCISVYITISSKLSWFFLVHSVLPAIAFLIIVFLFLSRENRNPSAIIYSNELPSAPASNTSNSSVSSSSRSNYDVPRRGYSSDNDSDNYSSSYSSSRPKHGLVGLKNQGATCYLNSLVQML